MSGEPTPRDPSAGGRPWLAWPLKFTLCLTTLCPLDCQPCYADCARHRGQGELDAATWLRLLDELADSGVINVFVEGGEPLARPDCELILAHAARRMFTTLRTHAVMIDQPAARRLARLGLGRAYVDLFGPDAATHDALAGVPGAFDRAVAGVANLRAAGIPVSILTILCAPNAPSLARMGPLALALGADELGVLRLYPLGRARREWASLALSLAAQHAALEALFAAMPKGLRLMHSWHPNDANCCWQNAAIDPYGHAIGCPYLREFVDYGDLARMRWEETWAHPLYRRLRAGNVPVHCADCAASQLTAGGCRATAYAFHRRWDAPDPYCERMNEGVDLCVLPD